MDFKVWWKAEERWKEEERRRGRRRMRNRTLGFMRRKMRKRSKNKIVE